VQPIQAVALSLLDEVAYPKTRPNLSEVRLFGGIGVHWEEKLENYKAEPELRERILISDSPLWKLKVGLLMPKGRWS
jgi:hypothetical protein